MPGEGGGAIFDDIRKLFVRDLIAFRREIELFPDDETVWWTVQGIANSAGTLVLHTCGNIQHFVGAVLGQTGYVRDREAEFSRRGVSRAELIRELSRTIDVVNRTLRSLPAHVAETMYPIPVEGINLRTDVFLMHLPTHLAFHLGQAGYVRHAVTGDGRSVDALEYPTLVEEQVGGDAA